MWRKTVRVPNSSVLDRGASFEDRIAALVAVAAADAEHVDREARFPKAAIDAARERKLLGAQIPGEFGGFGASIFDLRTCAMRSAAPAHLLP